MVNSMPTTHFARLTAAACRVVMLLAVAMVLTAGVARAAGPTLVGSDLGVASTFAVLGGQSVTNTGPSVITGNLGVQPGTAVTGFPPGLMIGETHAADAVSLQAQADALIAYIALAGQACDTDMTGQDLGGLTLVAGVYCFSSSAQLTGDLTLDAQGDPDAEWVFQVGSGLNSASNSSVQVINSGNACNVYWQVGSSATIGTGNTFVGNILALASISLATGTDLTGRALASVGSVTMDTNDISIQPCSTPTAVELSDMRALASPQWIPLGIGSLGLLLIGFTLRHRFLGKG